MTQRQELTAFRLGDVRGIYPEEIDETFAYRFAGAFARRFHIAGAVAIGRDTRASGISLQHALYRGFADCGIESLDLGLCPTELGYFASACSGVDAAIIVTASHNPARYNGFKCVLKGGQAVTFDTGLGDVMRSMLEGNDQYSGEDNGTPGPTDFAARYLSWLTSRFSPGSFQIGRIAVNGLNGTASTLAADIADAFGLPVTWFRKEPGPIPGEGADPGNPRLAAEMKSFMKDGDFALGVAWDGDCDRCVFFDGEGEKLPTYYVVGLLAEHFLQQCPGRAIVFDTKLCWNTLDIIAEHAGKPIPSQTGHAFMKQNMRRSNAIYGGEMSSHHFFGEFFHCDSGMLAWLNILKVLSQSGCTIAELISERRRRFCSIAEINLRLTDIDRAFREIREHYNGKSAHVREFDGLSVELPGDWRFSLTPSKTESLVRLNMESRTGDGILVNEGTKLLKRLQTFQADGTDLLDQLIIQ